MRSARIRIRPPNDATSGVHCALQEAESLGDALLLSGGISPPQPTELFAIEGDPGTVDAALDDRSEITDTEITARDSETTFVYVREERSEESRRVVETVTEGTLVATLPIRFSADGEVIFTLVGTADDLRTAVETLGQLASIAIDSIERGWLGHREAADRTPARDSARCVRSRVLRCPSNCDARGCRVHTRTCTKHCR